MRAVVGVQVVTGGTVEVLGLPAGDQRLRDRVGYVTQAPSVYDDLTVAENLRFFARVLGVAARARWTAASSAVDLGRARDQVVSRLSGGQRSRVSLAVALLGEPELLVLDEPTVGLDPVLRRDLWAMFHRLADEGTAVLVSSHVMDEAERCDRLLLMRDGQLLADDTPRRAPRAHRDDGRRGGVPRAGGGGGRHEPPDHRAPSPRRVLTQLRRDHRTLAMLLVLPCLILTLLWWMFDASAGRASGSTALGPPLLALIPFIVMFLVTSVTTLRERSSGTLERLLAMPTGKGDFLVGYALAFGLVAAVQSVLAVLLSVSVLGLDVAGPVWMLVVVAVADAVLGTALGLFVSAFARTEFQAVQFMPARGDPADPAVRAVRPARRDAAGARGDLRRAAAVLRRRRDDRRRVTTGTLRRRRRRCGPTSPSSRVRRGRRWPSVRPRCGAVPPDPGRAGPAYGVAWALAARGSRCPRWRRFVLRQPLLMLSRSDKVKDFVTAHAGVERHRVAATCPARRTEDAVEATSELDRVRAARDARLPRRGHPRPRAGRRHRGGVPRRARGAVATQGLARNAEVSVKLSAVGQALPDDGEKVALENARTHLPRRPQRRHHGDPRHGGPHHHRLDAAASCASCARTSPRPAPCCRPTCTAPRPTAATWPTRARGCGCARAPTTSPSRSPSRTSTTSTSPTSAASRC